ncbi:MAG TPA: hypothetical protein VK530_06555 [Candidatus Acidoferrum sp.]|nr:hypothetical protein [Candidatus Acidoferrum sp.]
MNDDLTVRVLTTWAAKNLPARLDVAMTAKVLGFAEHDIQILMAARKLTPLGDPAQNAPKWFAAIEIIELAANRDWLHRATKEVSKYWRHKRERRSSNAGKVSPASSPEVTLAALKPSGEEAIASGDSNF